MSSSYQAVLWNRQKRNYDISLLLWIVSYFFLFTILSLIYYPHITIETLVIRASGSASFILLHLILSIGPLSRLNSSFLPLLYNRRHLGVCMFLLASLHGIFALLQYHGFGDKNPLINLFLSNVDYLSLTNFPFQTLGFFALLILFIMAASSHDFWLANLTPPVWKSLHMGVYGAYALIILHVSLGTLQSEREPLLAWIVGGGLVLIVSLHIISSLREQKKDRPKDHPKDCLKDHSQFRVLKHQGSGYIPVCRVDEIEDSKAFTVTLSQERVAIFRYGDRISAVSNVCRHQGGPLGEGRIINGCIVCPWHGYQYQAENGSSPPPYTEKLPTFRVKVDEGMVYIHPHPLPAGTLVTPAEI